MSKINPPPSFSGQDLRYKGSTVLYLQLNITMSDKKKIKNKIIYVNIYNIFFKIKFYQYITIFIIILQAENTSGPISVLVNCAGTSVCYPFLETPSEDFMVCIILFSHKKHPK